MKTKNEVLEKVCNTERADFERKQHHFAGTNNQLKNRIQELDEQRLDLAQQLDNTSTQLKKFVKQKNELENQVADFRRVLPLLKQKHRLQIVNFMRQI